MFKRASSPRHLVAAFTVLLAILTTVEAKAPKYPFALEPEKAIAALDTLVKSAGKSRPMTADEKSLAADVKAGKFITWSLAEAALLADGVATKSKRKTLLQKYEAIRDAAKKAAAKGKTPAEKGKKLLDSLHASAMKNGYVENQTTLSGVLETGKFNCVSATVLYNAIAIDLGLEVDAVEEPGNVWAGHVYSRLIVENKRLVVETTNAKGFDAERAFHRNARVLTQAGLVADIYTNRAADLGNKKQYHEAVVLGILALSIDPGCSPNNGQAALAKWARALAAESKFQEAQLVHAVGLEIDPQNRDYKTNRKVTYLDWAASLNKQEKVDDALEVLRAAIKADPENARTYEGKQSSLFTSPGEALIKKGEWQKGHDLVAPGRKKLTGKALENLIAWQQGVYLRWGNSLFDAGEHEKALKVYGAGRKLYPEDRSLENNQWVTVNQWLTATHQKQGEDKARELAVRLKALFAGSKKIDETLNSHVNRVITPHLTGGKYELARASLQKHAGLLHAVEVGKYSRRIVAHQANALAEKGDWNTAHKVFAEAVNDAPDDKDLAELGANLWDRQARLHFKTKEWQQAIEIYEEGLKQYPKNSLLTNNRDYAKQEMRRAK